MHLYYALSFQNKPLMICEFHVYKELGSGGYTMGWVRIVTKYYPNVLYFNDISSITLFVNFVGWAVHVFFTQTHLKMTDAKSSFYALGTVAYSNRTVWSGWHSVLRVFSWTLLRYLPYFWYLSFGKVMCLFAQSLQIFTWYLMFEVMYMIYKSSLNFVPVHWFLTKLQALDLK